MTFPLPTAVERQTDQGRVWPFGPPIRSFRGRFVDSTSIQDITGPIRTIRASGVFPAPELDRLYMILGSMVAGYTLSSLFDTKLPQGMSYLPDRSGWPSPSESWLSPDFQFYAERSSWTTGVVHSQTAIGENIDIDDRGLVYVPYAAFGWGIFDSNLSSVVQVQDGATVTPEKILAVRSGPAYYAIVTDGLALTAIYDVSDPASASASDLRTRLIAPAFTSMAKATSPGGNHVVGAVTTEGKVIIATTANLALGGGPSQTFAVTYPYQYSSIASDGVNFYATKSSERGPMTVSVFSPNGSGSYTETPHEFPGAFRPRNFRYGASYLTAVGYDGENVGDVRLFKLEGGVPHDIPLSGYFRNFYTAPQQGYVPTPGYVGVRDAVVYRQGSREYLFFSAGGLGDVYELVGDGSAPPWEPPVNVKPPEPPVVIPPKPEPPVVEPEPPEPVVTCPPPPRYFTPHADKTTVEVYEWVSLSISVWQGQIERCHTSRWDCGPDATVNFNSPGGWHGPVARWAKSGTHIVRCYISNGTEERVSSGLVITVKEKIVAIATPGRRRGANRR